MDSKPKKTCSNCKHLSKSRYDEPCYSCEKEGDLWGNWEQKDKRKKPSK